MTWLARNKNKVRAIAFLLLLIAVFGPWVYHHDTPPAEWCKPPLYLLENGRCAGTMPGFFVLLVVLAYFPAGVLEFWAGRIGFIDLVRLLFASLFFLTLVLVPVISTILLSRLGESARRRIFSIVAWGLAAASGLFVALSAEAVHPTHLWGVWLYSSIAIGLLIFEYFAGRREHGLYTRRIDSPGFD